jgi:hypothetical protein
MRLLKLFLYRFFINLIILVLTTSVYCSNPNLHEYFYQYPRSIKDLSPTAISQILKNGAWITTDQSISSAETNNDINPHPDYNQIKHGDNAAGVNAFADIPFAKDVKRVLDVSGGKYDVCRNYMHTKQIELLVWDPYNCAKAHNNQVKQEVTRHKVDAATSMAVLNVIPEPEVRLAHIVTLKQSLKEDGYAIF